MAPNDRTDRKRDEETGHWRPQWSDEAILQAVKDVGGFATSGDVHRALGCSYETARRRLKELVEAGELETMEVAGRVSILSESSFLFLCTAGLHATPCGCTSRNTEPPNCTPNGRTDVQNGWYAVPI